MHSNNIIKTHILNCSVLVLATLAVYSCTFSHSILTVWDDSGYILNNETIRSVTWNNIKQAFSTFYLGNYAPLHILSYMLDYQLWGVDPRGYHIENVLIHSLNGILFYCLLIRHETRHWTALLAAAVFLLHPVQVESVAWLSQRKNLLAMLFFLSAWLSHAKYLQGEKRNIGWYLLAAGLFLCALLSKSVTVIFPFAVFLYEYCYYRETGYQTSTKELIPYLALTTAAAGMALVSQSIEFDGGRTEYPGGSLFSTACTMLPVFASYVKDCILPSKLLPYYMIPVKTYPDSKVILSFLLALGLAYASVFLWRRDRRSFFWLAFIFLALLPVSQIIPIVTLKNDRYLYFPLLGVAVLTARATEFIRHSLGRKGRLATIVILLYLVSFPVRTFHLANIWKDDITLWSYTATRDPDNILAWQQLAKLHTDKGNIARSLEAIENYARIKERNLPIWGWSE